MRFIEDAIIGRFYGDEFVVFVYNDPKSEFVRQCAEEVIRTIALPYLFPNLSQSVNVSCGIILRNGRILFSRDYTGRQKQHWRPVSPWEEAVSLSTADN
ncbi:MAG: hypothetical protein ACLRMZ_09135 [Blautia marasmi]